MTINQHEPCTHVWKNTNGYEVQDANTGSVIAAGFATISDALDHCETIDPDDSRGVFACATAQAEEYDVLADDAAFAEANALWAARNPEEVA